MWTTLYGASIVLLTAAMAILHLLEWKAAFAMRLVPAAGPAAGAGRLETALWLEALYYVVALPAWYPQLAGPSGRLMALFAVLHWAVLGLFLGARRAGRKPGRAGAGTVWAIAAFDLTEMAVLGWFCVRLFGSLMAAH